jgi:hypothetical protein
MPASPERPPKNTRARVYFDPASPARVVRRGNRLLVLGAAVVSIAVGLVIAAREAFDWVTFLFGAGAVWLTLAVLGGVLLWLARDQAPHAPVTCRSCAAKGWIEDLEGTGGACPRCGGARYDYYDFRFGRYGGRFETRAEDVTGETLLGWRKRSFSRLRGPDGGG